MTYETPVPTPGASTWGWSVQDTSVVSAGAGEEGMTVHLSFSSTDGGFSPYEGDLLPTENLFQKIITALEAHADLTVTRAQRNYPTFQDITP